MATDLRLSIAIQHHPARADLLPRLLGPLLDAEVVSDPDPTGPPSPLRTYLEALRRTPTDATHRLVLQDDATLCADFRLRSWRAVAEYPNVILCLFVPGIRNGGAGEVRDAAARGDRFAQLRTNGRVLPCVATVWPAAVAADFLAFMSDARYERERSDDGMAAKFASARKLEVWATVPSLVQHEDAVASLIGRKASAGANVGRVAALYDG